jgi:hypothetical protein
MLPFLILLLASALLGQQMARRSAKPPGPDEPLDEALDEALDRSDAPIVPSAVQDRDVLLVVGQPSAPLKTERMVQIAWTPAKAATGQQTMYALYQCLTRAKTVTLWNVRNECERPFEEDILGRLDSFETVDVFFARDPEDTQLPLLVVRHNERTLRALDPTNYPAEPLSELYMLTRLVRPNCVVRALPLSLYSPQSNLSNTTLVRLKQTSRG